MVNCSLGGGSQAPYAGAQPAEVLVGLQDLAAHACAEAWADPAADELAQSGRAILPSRVTLIGWRGSAMQCARCGADNRESRRSWAQCGARLAAACSAWAPSTSRGSLCITWATTMS
jgi:hypothetical protein